MVDDRQTAVNYVEGILKLHGQIIVVGGHIVINERVMRRRSTWLPPARYIGLLAGPFDITAEAS